MQDYQDSTGWGKYLSTIGWKIETIDGRQLFVRPVPLFKRSIIKIQRQKNPLPFSKIDDVAKKQKALFVLVEPSLNNYDEKSFKKSGFELSKMTLAHTATILVEIKKSEKEQFKSLSENARRNINKSLKNNLTIKSIFMKNSQDLAEFKIFYNLFKNLSKIKKFYIPSKHELYQKMIALKQNSVLLFVYSSATEPIATVWLYLYKDTMFYLNTGITEEGYKTLANYLLVWEALKLSIKKGVKTFDFSGIYDPRYPKERKRWVKFSEFKHRFHGQSIEYPPVWIKFYNPFFKFFFLCSNYFSN